MGGRRAANEKTGYGVSDDAWTLEGQDWGRLGAPCILEPLTIGFRV